MKNTLLYTLILIVVVMLVVDIVVMFMSKRPYHVVHYDAIYEYGYTSPATFTTTTRVLFRKEGDLQKYLESMKEGATEVIQKYFDDLGEKLKRKLTVISYSYSTKKIDPNTLEIKEVLVLKGVVVKKFENGETVYEASLGNVKLNAVADSTVEVVLPKGATVLKVEPEPSGELEREGKKVLVWKGGGIKNFPKVVFK